MKTLDETWSVKSNGFFHSRFFQPVFVVATGKQTAKDDYTPLDVTSSRLKRKGAEVFVLGIGKDVDSSELTQIATGPGNIFMVDNFGELNDKANELKRRICISGSDLEFPTSCCNKAIS